MLDALTYLLLNSTLLISVLALVFFLLGLWLGRLLWGRYQHDAHHLDAALKIAHADLEIAREETETCRRSAEAELAECRRALAERPDPETTAEPVPSDPDEVEDVIGELRKQLDKTGSELEIARAEAEQLADRLSEAGREAGHLHGENQRLEAELQRTRAGTPGGASPEAGAQRAPAGDTLTSGAEDNGALPGAWVGFQDDLATGRAQIDDTLGLVFAHRPETADDLTKIKGIAKVLNAKLNDIGVYTYRQIAGWDDRIVAAFSQRLSFSDRVQRDDWVGQSRRLHAEKYGEALD